MKTGIMWMGESIDNMPKDRLLEIIECLSEEQRERYSPENIRAFALGKVEMIKRGEA